MEAESKPQVDNVVPSIFMMDEIVAAQNYRTTEQITAKEISGLVAKALDDIPICIREHMYWSLLRHVERH